MASEKDAARQDNDEEDDDSSEDFPEGDEEVDEKKANSLTGVLNAKIAALAIASLIIGILIGQVALPGLGVGLASLPSADGGNGGDNIDTAALQLKVQNYVNENLLTEGVTATVDSLEKINENLSVAVVTIEAADGQKQQAGLYITNDGKSMLAGQIQLFQLDEPLPEVQQPAQQQAAAPPVVGQLESFNDSGYNVELQDGKPVIRLFSTTGCPHCIWIKPTFDRVVKEYVDAGKIVAYHWETNIGDDTLTEAVETAVPDSEIAVNAHFGGGYVPAFVLGGKYYRVGNGFEGQGDTANPTSEQSLANLAKEEAALRAVIDKLIEEAKQ